MTRYCCFLLWCGALLLCFRAPARAGLEAGIATLEGSGVTVKVTGPANKAPSEGCFFCWVTIHNRSGGPHTWNLQGNLGDRGNRGDRLATSQSVRVENESSARVPVLLPMTASGPRTYYYQSVALRVEGYGIESPEVSVASNGTGRAPSAFVGMGEALATPIWSSLEKDYRDRSANLVGTPVTPALFGSDWRALSGFGCLWLTDGEYGALDPGQRVAIRRWVDQGGVFYLSARILDPAWRTELGLPETGDEAQPGFGQVKWLAWDGQPLDLNGTAATIDHVRHPRSDPDTRDATSWAMTRSVGTIPLNAPFLLTFIGLFAVVAGPVNLFLLAPASRRHRLFWTTPLISCVASLLLILVIVFQDGFGGHGERLMVTRLFPGQKQAVVIQEQVTRTGVLLSRQFSLPDDVLLTALELQSTVSRTFEQSGRNYGGDWFMSRLVQAHRAVAIVPSRAEIQLLNSNEVEGGAAPVVVSSIAATLSKFDYLDAAGRHWSGQNLHTGERMALRPQQRASSEPVATGSKYLLGLQESARKSPGSFVAVADNGPYIDTLPAIRWHKQQAVYLGPVTSVH